MLFKRKPSLSWWRFTGAMTVALLPLGFLVFVLGRESDPFGAALLIFLSASAVAYAAVRWRALRQTFNGDADAAAAAIRQNLFGQVFGSPRLFVVWVLCNSLVMMAAVIAWALWTLR